MPTLMDTLSQDNKVIALRLIDHLNTIKPEVMRYNEQLNEFKRQLSSVDRTALFFDLVNDIIITEGDLHALLFPGMDDVDGDIINAISEQLMQDGDWAMLMDVLHFDNLVSARIIETKERLSATELANTLPSDKKVIFEAFIARVKALQPVANIFDAQQEHAREQLKNVTSLEEVNDLDEQLSKQGAAIASVYASMISYPEDEETAGVVIEYLETNPHRRAIMQSFDFYAALEDDILGARAEMSGFSMGI